LASSFQQAGLNEKIAAEDVRQAQAAFLPRVSAPLSYLYTSRLLACRRVLHELRVFSLTMPSANTRPYLNVSGDIDIAGAYVQLSRERALLEAAHAGTRCATCPGPGCHRGLLRSALATAQRNAAELNLTAAEEF